MADSFRLFVGGMTGDVTPESLQSTFGQFGTVRDVQVVAHKGFAYVTLSNTDESRVKRCIFALNSTKWRGNKLRLEVAKPEFQERLKERQKQDVTTEEERKATRLAKIERRAKAKLLPPAKRLATSAMDGEDFVPSNPYGWVRVKGRYVPIVRLARRGREGGLLIEPKAYAHNIQSILCYVKDLRVHKILTELPPSTHALDEAAKAAKREEVARWTSGLMRQRDAAHDPIEDFTEIIAAVQPHKVKSASARRLQSRREMDDDESDFEVVGGTGNADDSDLDDVSSASFSDIEEILDPKKARMLAASKPKGPAPNSTTGSTKDRVVDNKSKMLSVIDSILKTKAGSDYGDSDSQDFDLRPSESDRDDVSESEESRGDSDSEQDEVPTRQKAIEKMRATLQDSFVAMDVSESGDDAGASDDEEDEEEEYGDDDLAFVVNDSETISVSGQSFRDDGESDDGEEKGVVNFSTDDENAGSEDDDSSASSDELYLDEEDLPKKKAAPPSSSSSDSDDVPELIKAPNLPGDGRKKSKPTQVEAKKEAPKKTNTRRLEEDDDGDDINIHITGAAPVTKPKNEMDIDEPGESGEENPKKRKAPLWAAELAPENKKFAYADLVKEEDEKIFSMMRDAPNSKDKGGFRFLPERPAEPQVPLSVLLDSIGNAASSSSNSEAVTTNKRGGKHASKSPAKLEPVDPSKLSLFGLTGKKASESSTSSSTTPSQTSSSGFVRSMQVDRIQQMWSGTKTAQRQQAERNHKLATKRVKSQGRF